MRKRIFLGLIIAVFVILPSLLSLSVVWASEESAQKAHAEGGEHGETIWQIIGKWFNFAALVAILYLFLVRTIKVPARFQEGAQQIQRSIESARQAKEEAEMRLQEMNERMDQMNQEVARIREQAAREAEEEKQRILESAQMEAERIVEMAHREIENEIRLARKELRRKVAELAVQQGKQIIEEEIAEDDHKRLIKNYIEGFGK